MARVGVDIGGTFTDVVCRDGQRTIAFKTPTTREDPSRAVALALTRLAEAGVDPRTIDGFAHGTTIATNAVIERAGARTGLITTEGFSDTLVLGRQMRRQLYDLVLAQETPEWLAPGPQRAEVRERIGADGSVVVPLDWASVERAIARLREAQVDAVAICLLFSFLDPSHEEAVAEAVRAAMPSVAISVSHTVDPQFREYERTVATLFDAYVKPTVDRYLARLSDELCARGVAAPLAVMQSRGGLSGVATARSRPSRLFLSGPAAGVVGAVEVARGADAPDAVSIDIGGTSSDIALIENGEPAVAASADIGGTNVRVPMLDIVTLGAGGGSIARAVGGALTVGPQSAGADPGPAAYGKGDGATVTDASLVLGFLDADAFAGGTITLDAERAHAAVLRVGEALGLSAVATAQGIHRVANAAMADGIRLVSLKRGHDVRGFALVVLGGGGGLHGAALADELLIERVLVPPRPGVLSAEGLLVAPTQHEVASAHPVAFADADLDALKEDVTRLHERAAALFEADGHDPASAQRTVSADVAYQGQSHTLEIPFDLQAAAPMERLYEAFEREHERINGLATSVPAKLVNLRVVHTLAAAPPCVADKLADDRPDRTRAVIFHDEPLKTLIVWRPRLREGERIEGPAILEQSDATTLVPPGWTALASSSGTLILTRDRRAGDEFNGDGH